MKILIVNTSDVQGGAARAACRLHQALLDSGVDSQMLVQSKSSDSDTVIGSFNKKTGEESLNRIRSFLDALPVHLYIHKTQTLFSPAFLPFSGIVDTIEAVNPDVVHLHWICGGMISIEEIGKIKKPIIWSLHDMWAFTGGCHYDEGCGKYKSGCSSCPVLGSKKAKDLSHKVFTRKQKTFAELGNLTVVGLSRWLAGCARQSILFADKRIVNLPNPINTTKFTPQNKVKAREIFNLPADKKIVLYGALSATSDPRKGYKELMIALGTLPKRNDRELVVFGSSRPDDSPEISFKSHFLGNLDERSLQLIYCAADVMVVPSLQENLSNGVMESLACGTPVVAFDTGGNRDMIDHKKNGYLANPFDTISLAEGIEWVTNHPTPHVLSQNARQKVMENFDAPLVAQKYIALYRDVLEKEQRTCSI